MSVVVDAAAVLEYLRSEARRPMKGKELARALEVATADYPAFRKLLRAMESDGTLYRVQRQRYAAPGRINLVAGRLQSIRSGAGFVLPDEGGPDIFVPADRLGSALDGDHVIVRVEERRDGQHAGTVIRVLERARSTVVGVYHIYRGRAGAGYVTPEDRHVNRDVVVAAGAAHEATDGDVVVVRIADWGDRRRSPAGVIERVLGRAGEPGVDVLAIVHGHELPVEFPAPVEREAERLAARGIGDREFEDRTDLRDLHVVTIDPADAKDHDDALSIEQTDAGQWVVGIHIADVSHYVRDESALDVEALARGTSVYLVDRVLPMLPHALSSGLCSLLPGEDRLALSLLLRLDASATVLDARLVRSVIRSRHRLTYDRAQAALDREATIDRETDEALRALAALSRVLREIRTARGSLDFDLPESRVVLNAAGEPTDIQRVLRLESHRLIEGFMLLANETIAERAARARLPFIYRIHEAPDAARLEQLAELARAVSLRASWRGKPGPKDLQALLEEVRGRPSEALISMAVLRAMKQARYSHENVGHFGLAAERYTHFTSPIRRYPDLMVHRLCARYLLDGAPPSPGRGEGLEMVARRSSERERVAVEAERDSVDLKKVEFMERHLGDEFEGTIASVRAFGFFVLLDAFHVEGLVHVSSLEDDYYAFIEERLELVGDRAGRSFRLGDRVSVRVASVQREERRIDFVLAGERQVQRPQHGRRGARRRRR